MRKSIKCLLGCSLVLTMTASLTGCSLFPKETEKRQKLVETTEEDSMYNYGKVEQGDITVTADLSCGCNPMNETGLTFHVNGIEYDKFNVSVGDKVKKGQVLGQLKMDDLVEQCNEKELEYKKAQLELSYINTQIADQAKECRLSNMTSSETSRAMKELNNQKVKVTEQYNLAKEKYDEVNEKKSARQVVATMNGIVTYVYEPDANNTNSGGNSPDAGAARSVSNMNQTVIRISDANYQFVTYTTQYKSFPKGTHVKMTVKDQEYEMVVSDIISSSWMGEEEDQRQLVLDFVDKPYNISNDELGMINQVIDKVTNVLYVPNSAIVTINNKDFVYVINEDGIREAKEVTTGVTDGSIMEVKEGLKAGEKVILN